MRAIVTWKRSKDKRQMVTGVQASYPTGKMHSIFFYPKAGETPDQAGAIHINTDLIETVEIIPDEPQPPVNEAQVEMPLEGGELRVA